MSLEEILEARLAGRQPEVPDDVADDLRHALAAHGAIQFALGETILLPASEAADRTPPELPADYEIVRELGRGGMGVVYLARQNSLDRFVAVKVLRPGEMAFAPMVRRFLDEAKHLARLRHPNLVSVHEVGEAGGEPYFSMDYIEGESLADLLRRERMSPSRALAILKQAAEGVAHAHQTGIIHRDLKPANILIDAAGRAYVTDFGLARNLTDESDRTRSGVLMGTPQYMAPEQARGETPLVGEVTDVHALGAVLYEMLTGRPPYGSDNPMQILVRLVHEEPMPPRRIDARISRDLETICLKALIKQPAARYATVRAMLEDIHRYETGRPLMARRPGLAYHAKRLARRYGKLVVAAGVAAILATAAALAVAPKLFDKSVEELVTWGESEQQAGRQAEALNIYRRALVKATPAQRPELIDRMVRCVREIDEPGEAVENALELLDLSSASLSIPTTDGHAVGNASELLDGVPEASFGKYDLLVAQSLLTRLRGRYPGWDQVYDMENSGKRPRIPNEARPLMQLLEKRLAIALQGPSGTPDERRECNALAQLVRKRLAGKTEPDAAWAAHVRSVATLTDPLTGPQDLIQVASDEFQNPGMRIVAAFLAGEMLEKSGEMQRAFESYSNAYRLRSRFPFYSVTLESRDAADLPTDAQPKGDAQETLARFVSPFTAWYILDARHSGVLQELGKSLFPGVAPQQSEVCRALRDAYAGCRRLSGASHQSVPDDLRGGVRVRFEGRELPRSLNLHSNLFLTLVGDTTSGATIQLQPITAANYRVGIVDGRYRLRQSGASWSAYSKEEIDLVEALFVDASALPAELEVRGETIDLPPIWLRVLAEIKTISPTEGAAIDLREVVFRWSPISNATTYRVDFVLERADITGELPGLLRGLAHVQTNSTSLYLGTLSRKELNSLPQELTPGRTGVWSVEAYDANQVKIGRTFGRGARFLVTRGLEQRGE